MKGLGNIIAGSTCGYCDLKSPWGGVFFYGIHQVDLILETFGYNVTGVRLTRTGRDAVGQMIYPDGKIISLHMVADISMRPPFSMTVHGTKKSVLGVLHFDRDPYLAGIKIFTRMFKTGKEPRTHDDILMSVRVLEAMQKALKSGKRERV